MLISADADSPCPSLRYRSHGMTHTVWVIELWFKISRLAVISLSHRLWQSSYDRSLKILVRWKNLRLIEIGTHNVDCNELQLDDLRPHIFLHCKVCRFIYLSIIDMILLHRLMNSQSYIIYWQKELLDLLTDNINARRSSTDLFINKIFNKALMIKLEFLSGIFEY